MSPLFVFDILGTFAFAVYGAYVAQRKGFDVFGVAVCAFVSAVGGSTLRDGLFQRLPVYFFDSTYVIAILIGIVFSILVFHQFEKVQKFMLWIDALGLVTFAFIGATKAFGFGLGLLGVILFAVVSAVGGGIIRDLMVGEVPQIFYQDFYATPAIILGIIYVLLQPWVYHWYVAYGIIVVVFILRLLAIKFRLQLWKPRVAETGVV